MRAHRQQIDTLNAQIATLQKDIDRVEKEREEKIQAYLNSVASIDKEKNELLEKRLAAIDAEIKNQQNDKELLQQELSSLRKEKADARNSSGNSVQSAIARIEEEVEQAESKFETDLNSLRTKANTERRKIDADLAKAIKNKKLFENQRTIEKKFAPLKQKVDDQLRADERRLQSRLSKRLEELNKQKQSLAGNADTALSQVLSQLDDQINSKQTQLSNADTRIRELNNDKAKLLKAKSRWRRQTRLDEIRLEAQTKIVGYQRRSGK